MWTAFYLVATVLCVLGLQSPHSPAVKVVVFLLALAELAGCMKLLGDGLPAVVALYKVRVSGPDESGSAHYSVWVCVCACAILWGAVRAFKTFFFSFLFGPLYQVRGLGALPDLEEGRESGGVLLVMAWIVLVLVGTFAGTQPRPKGTKRL